MVYTAVYDVAVGGLTCKITRGSFFGWSGPTASLSDADDELLHIVCADACALLLGLRATSGVVLPLNGFLRSRRDIDVGATQRRDCCGGVR